MKYYFFVISILIIILGFNCTQTTTGQSSNAQIIIQAPDSINPPLFSINTSSGGSAIKQLDTSTLDQNSIRYEVIVQSNGHRLSDTILNRSDRKAISVISGIPLDIFVGVFYSVGRSSNEELYNVFLASASVKGFEVMSGQSKNVNLTLNLTNKQPVDTYFDTSIFGSKGFAEITGGAYAAALLTYTNLPTFSIKQYDNPNSKLIIYNNYTFNQPNLGASFFNGRGVLSSNISDPLGLYWYVPSGTGTGIYRNNQYIDFTSYYTSIVDSITSIPNGVNNIGNTSLIKSITKPNTSFVSNNTNYIDFLINNKGFFGLFATTSGFTNYSYTDTSNFNNIYPSDPFLLDAILDSSNPDTNNKWIFLATKAGLFYITNSTLNNYAIGNLNQALDASKKLIMIQNSNRPVLITNVVINGNRVFLGTKQGIYYLDENSSSWASFINSSNSTFNTFDTGSINKLALNEPIERLFNLTVGSSNILVATTPNQIYFFNTSDGRSASITVWDGFPFIPAYGVSSPSYNANEYYIHNMAPVNAVIYDSTNSKFWFATTYGLASVNLSSLGL